MWEEHPGRSQSFTHLVLAISGRSIRALGNAYTAKVNAKVRKVAFSLTLPF